MENKKNPCSVIFSDLMGTLIWRDEVSDDALDIEVLKDFGLFDEALSGKYEVASKQSIKWLLREASVEQRAKIPHLFWIKMNEILSLGFDEKTLIKINDSFNDKLLDHLTVNTKLVRLIRSMRKCKVYTVMVTNSYHHLADRILKRFPEIAGIFDEVYCADDLMMKKSQGALKHIMDKLGADPKTCVIFGDDESEDGANEEVLFLKIMQDPSKYNKC